MIAKSDFREITGPMNVGSIMHFLEFLLFLSTKGKKLLNLEVGLMLNGCGRLCLEEGCLDGKHNNG